MKYRSHGIPQNQGKSMPFKRITKQFTPEEKAKFAEIRRKAKIEFPPSESKLKPAKEGIGAQIRKAREAQKLTWYAVAKAAGIPHPGTVRDLEYGRDVHLSNLEAVARVLGLKVELVEA
jgi:hypothetical protein